ncbi:AmmeMemoRadiSam system radical SAM enzyme [Candidatus Poribacteria bacterium]|nr:AmmeMemoRadiSam system radical SAM enzyme [Candidatus Poribacteria bacterium]
MTKKFTRREFIKDAVKKGTAIAIVPGIFSSVTKAEHAIPSTEGLKEAMFYQTLDGGVMIECMLEPRGCIVNNWERGYCGAKENRDGKYYSLVYSNPCTVYVEPIERENFYHILPGQQFLGIGTAGCNLECKFCETWHISQVRPEETETQNLTPEDAINLSREKDCRIIAFTYNEPVICYEYTLEIAKLARKAGIKTICHTAGYIYPEPLKALMENMDAVNVDLKGFSEDYYEEICGIEMSQVLESLKLINRLSAEREKPLQLEITNLVVPGKNDSPEELSRMTAWIRENLGADIPLHFSRFFPNYQLMDILATPLETLEKARDIALSNGLNFVYLGNIPGHKYSSTYCPNCGTMLIDRSNSEVTRYNLDMKGKCSKCSYSITGIWY